VVLSGDILGCAEEEIKELCVVVTVMAGKIVYREES
jgi:predicted amidohydrolase YtcJ